MHTVKYSEIRDDEHFHNKAIEETIGEAVTIAQSRLAAQSEKFVEVGEWSVKLDVWNEIEDGKVYVLFTVTAYSQKMLRTRSGTYGWKLGVSPNFYLIDDDGIQRD